jgi:hypothetical protein
MVRKRIWQQTEDFMNKLIAKLQKDLNMLQTTLEREGDKLVKKIKTAAKKNGVPTDVDHFETLIEEQVKKFEPALDKFLGNVKTSAAKYGIELDGIEQKVRHTAKVASTKLRPKRKKATATNTTGSTRATKASGTTAKKAKATRAKAAPKKVSAKKATRTSR